MSLFVKTIISMDLFINNRQWTKDVACVAGVNGKGERKRERGKKWGSGG